MPSQSILEQIEAVKRQIESLSVRLKTLMELAAKNPPQLPEGFIVASVEDTGSPSDNYELPEIGNFVVVPKELGDRVYVRSDFLSIRAYRVDDPARKFGEKGGYLYGASSDSPEEAITEFLRFPGRWTTKEEYHIFGPVR